MPPVHSFTFRVGRVAMMMEPQLDLGILPLSSFLVTGAESVIPLSLVAATMTSLAELETEQRMLEEIVRQVKKANPTLTWLDELDTTSVRSFKQCYARGNWWAVPADQFTDLFGCGCPLPAFTFNEGECEFLCKHFGIYMIPHDGAPRHRAHATGPAGRWHLVNRRKRRRG